MAKKKNIEPVEEAVPESNQFPKAEEETPKSAVPETDAKEETNSQEEASVEMNPVPEDKTPAKENVELPVVVLNFFKNHPEEKAVFADAKGGLFTSDVPKVFVKDAILYHNPNNK